MPLSPNTTLGRYEIRSQLGAGGMGEVYLAQDTRLERTVALKVLASSVANDPKRMQRFIQEAKAASALNHPNIITIHEIEQIDSVHFITTELIRGETLRHRMARGRLSFPEVFDIAIQIGSALVAAHEAGIIHRDVKPENVMLRSDGILKVLDFGLAKLTERSHLDIDTEAATRALVQTEPGLIMGTANYMSPEQARGKEVDTRTDIWSLGVVIYEMIAGHAPFAGETSTDIIASIIKVDPQPLSTKNPEVPPKLEEIVLKALEKDPEDRYQTVKDLLVDLRKLRKRLDFESELERTNPPASSLGHQLTTSSGQQHATTASAGVAASTLTAGDHPTTSAEYLISEIKRHKTGVAVAAIVLIVLIAGGAFAWFKLRADQTVKPPGQMKITRLVTALQGRPSNVSVSPDGKYVAYSLQVGGDASLWIRQVTQDSSIQIVAPEENGVFNGVTFSPDGDSIYFVRVNTKTDRNGSLYQIPVLGGREPRKILPHVTGRVSFSPDGKQIVFLRYDERNEESALMIGNADGTGQLRRISSRVTTGWYAPGSAAWSPDGKRIAVGAASVPGGIAYTVVEIPVEGGSERPLTTQKWPDGLFNLSWLRDDTGLLFSAREKASDAPQIWHLALPSGEVRRVTNDLNTYGTFGVTADGNTIVVNMGDSTSRVWVQTIGADEGKAQRITNGKADGRYGLDWTPDGRLVVSATVGENVDLWLMNADGSGVKALTSDAYLDWMPRVSADGSFIVWVSYRPDDIPHVWRVNMDGSGLKQLTTAEDYEPIISPDGQWVVFTSWRSGVPTLWRVPAGGGNEEKLSDLRVDYPDFSPDGKQLVFFHYDESLTPPRNRPVLFDLETRQITANLEAPPNVSAYFWHANGREFIYSEVKDDVMNIWSVPVSGGTPRPLTRFSSELGEAFALSRDGKRIAVSRRTVNNEIVLIRDFR